MGVNVTRFVAHAQRVQYILKTDLIRSLRLIPFVANWAQSNFASLEAHDIDFHKLLIVSEAEEILYGKEL